MAAPSPNYARRGLAAALTIALLTGPHAASAADPAPASAAGKPPRIGLALSGGGARGIAHVGVLNRRRNCFGVLKMLLRIDDPREEIQTEHSKLV